MSLKKIPLHFSVLCVIKFSSQSTTMLGCCPLHWVITLLLFSTISILLHTSTTCVQAAHSRRRVVVSQSNERTYDREITTFSPDGRLPQIEYGMEAVMQRGSPVGLLIYNDTVLMATTSSFAKVHRLDDSKFLVTTGLSGDGRMVAHQLRLNCQQFYLDKGEVPTVKETAEMAATMFHSLTKMAGRRPLACRAVVVGVEEDDDGESNSDDNPSFNVRVFQTDPGGGMEECMDCLAVGKGQDALYKELQKILEKERSKKETTTFLDRLAIMAQKLAGALERISGNGQASSSSWRRQKPATTSPQDVWIIQPRQGRRGNMLATVYSHNGASDDSNFEDLVRKHHDEL